MSMVGIHVPQPSCAFSNQCVTERTRLRVLLHFTDNTYNFGEKLNYPVRDKNRKIIQQARENFPKEDCLDSQQEDACLESAATESVDLGKDSNFLGCQNFLRLSNHRV